MWLKHENLWEKTYFCILPDSNLDVVVVDVEYGEEGF